MVWLVTGRATPRVPLWTWSLGLNRRTEATEFNESREDQALVTGRREAVEGFY